MTSLTIAGFVTLLAACGDESIKHQHEWGEWETKTPATCTAAEIKKHTCQIDGTEETETFGSALGHIYGNWVIKTQADMYNEGTKQEVCTRTINGTKCGEVLNTQEIPMPVVDDIKFSIPVAGLADKNAYVDELSRKACAISIQAEIIQNRIEKAYEKDKQRLLAFRAAVRSSELGVINTIGAAATGTYILKNMGTTHYSIANNVATALVSADHRLSWSAEIDALAAAFAMIPAVNSDVKYNFENRLGSSILGLQHLNPTKYASLYWKNPQDVIDTLKPLVLAEKDNLPCLEDLLQQVEDYAQFCTFIYDLEAMRYNTTIDHNIMVEEAKKSRSAMSTK